MLLEEAVHQNRHFLDPFRQRRRRSYRIVISPQGYFVIDEARESNGDGGVFYVENDEIVTSLFIRNYRCDRDLWVLRTRLVLPV